MTKIKESLFSNRGMNIVNIMFFLSISIRNRGITFIAYLAWIVYLAFGIKTTSSKATKIINSIFLAFAAVIIAVNVCVMLHFI